MTKIISQLSVTDDEYAAIKLRASNAQLPTTAYIIAAAVNPERFADQASGLKDQDDTDASSVI